MISSIQTLPKLNPNFVITNKNNLGKVNLPNNENRDPNIHEDTYTIARKRQNPNKGSLITSQSKSRKVHQVSKNLAASVDCRDPKDFDSKILIDHAYLRVHTFAIQALAYYRTAVLSDGTRAPIEISVSRARKQIGQAHIQGFHAAHPNSASGVCDNRMGLIAKEIALNGMSPNKEKILKAKNFPAKTLEGLCKQTFDEQKVKQLLEEHLGNLPSLIEDDDAINLTNCVPGSEVNLALDGAFERENREQIANLLTQCAKDELNPEEATTKYVEMINKFFHKKALELKGLIKSYPLDDKVKRWTLLKEYCTEQLKGTEMPPFEYLFGVVDSESKKARKMNEDELMQLHYQLLRKPPVPE